MASCPNAERCPLFPLFSLRGALKVWQSNYCEADYERCARYQRGKEGRPIPANLLPNGAMLSLALPTQKP